MPSHWHNIKMHSIITRQTKQRESIWEMLQAIPRSDFIVIGSHLTTTLVQMLPHFQNIYGN